MNFGYSAESEVSEGFGKEDGVSERVDWKAVFAGGDGSLFGADEDRVGA